MKIKSFSDNYNPKQKVKLKGMQSLSTTEILSIIINNGNKKYNAIEISSNLLNKYRSLYNISKLTISDLTSNYGIGENIAIRILVSLNSIKFDIPPTNLLNFKSVKIASYQYFIDNSYEKLVIFYLNDSYTLIKVDEITQYDKEKIVIPKDKIRNECIRFYCKYIILLHNHPNNVCEFSRDDINSFIKLKKNLVKDDIFLIDNVLYTEWKIINIKSML